jgi:hypothetical protein
MATPLYTRCLLASCLSCSAQRLCRSLTVKPQHVTCSLPVCNLYSLSSLFHRTRILRCSVGWRLLQFCNRCLLPHPRDRPIQQLQLLFLNFHVGCNHSQPSPVDPFSSTPDPWLQHLDPIRRLPNKLLTDLS